MIKTTKNLYEALLVLFKDKNLNLHSMANKTKISVAGISKIIKKLKDENVVKTERIGKSLVVNLNLEINNIELFSLAEKYNFDKFVGEYPGLKGFLLNLKNKLEVDFALMFGSYASREAKPDSDLDLLIVSNKENEKIIKESSSLVNMYIAPIFIKKEDFIKEFKNKHRLYTEIVNGKKVLIKGEYDFWKTVIGMSQ